jgi:hypothetical protein
MGFSERLASFQQSHRLIASDRVEGTQVRRPDGHKLGEIKRVMIDKVSGQVHYAVMRFGGLFGIGGYYHAVPWQELKYDAMLGAYQLDISDERLRDAAVHEAEETDWGERVPMPAEAARPRHWGV